MPLGTRELLDNAAARARRGERVILCVITETRGSTPQPRGAKMLVLENGETLGTLGGGCVEAEVRTRALALPTLDAVAMPFSLDQDYGWDDGLVCGGRLTVLAVPIAGERIEAIEADELKLAAEGSPDYVERVTPPAPLFIAGAGHVGEHLARFAADLDFAVTVIDDREHALSETRFPRATRHLGEIATTLKAMPIDAFTFIVIVTRGHKNDAAALHAVVDSSARYIGLIGSKRKIKAIYDQLHSAGVSIERLQRIHAPIGLNIDAVGPAEIAVSIAAELIAVRRGAIHVSAMKMNDDDVGKWLTRESNAS